jgi:nucleotide-binding universal stress UspA family protein
VTLLEQEGTTAQLDAQLVSVEALSPGRGLHEQAEDQGADLLVGSRGYGPVKRLMLGSTSDYLQRHARCSLLVLPRVASGQNTDSTASSELQAENPIGATA